MAYSAFLLIHRLLLFCLLIPGASLLLGQTYPSGFSEVQVVAGPSIPTCMAFAPDGRIFVCQQTGALHVVKDGALLPAPFLTVSVSSTSERGLVGVAFDPDFANNQYVYIFYSTATAPIHNRVSRFTADGDVAVPNSEVAILDMEDLGADQHNGGGIHFGPDGNLYVTTGENEVAANAQTLDNRLGKVLRLNSDGTIPADNPFYDVAVGDNRAIWALGLRNPFRLDFHPQNGRMHVNDVGAGRWEEVNLGVPGANYGWPIYEGSDGGDPNFDDPVIAYGHSGDEPTGCAITGGAFYTGTNYPSNYAGAYFYGDLCRQWIYYSPSPAYTAQVPFGTALGKGVVDLQVWDGELYYLTRSSGGGIFRITYTPPPMPDLTLTSVIGPPQGSVGQTINVSLAEVLNSGAVAAPASRVGFYFSDNPAGGPTRIFSGSTCNLGALAAGATDSCADTTVQVPLVAPGTYWLVAIVDDDEAVPESDEANNVLADSRPITLIDCANPGQENCLDGFDNDCDGLVDSDDPDCQNACIPTGDSCFDPDSCCSGKCKGGKSLSCKGKVKCEASESFETSCLDRIDNDCDGFTDGVDADCACTATETSELSCSDGVDNDCDGFIDAGDSDCDSFCSPKGAWCAADDECCSNKCRGPSNNMTCK